MNRDPAEIEMPRPVGARWTVNQWRGITTTGKSVLVSAAAGSGKTAMLAERCAYLVCDAPPAQRCDVTDLLVVTFTDAAAVEMRSRIQAALRAKAASASSPRLAGQLNLLDQMSVSTLHAFCARILRQHFHRVGLDPAFSVLDGEEAKLLRNEVARQLFEDRYELDDSGDFAAFVDVYGDGKDESLVTRVIRTHEMLTSLVHPQQWLDMASAKIEEAASAAPLAETKLGERLVKSIQAELASAASRCDDAFRAVRAIGGFPQYEQALEECRQILAHLRHIAAEGPLDELSDEANITFERLPNVKGGTPFKETAMAHVVRVRDDIKKGYWRKLLNFTERQWREGMASVAPHAVIFVGLVREFGRRYAQAKAAVRALDFSDLERFAFEVLRDPSSDAVLPGDIARSYQRRFQYVLVDEYQDINQLQDAIIRLLSRENAADGPGVRPNLFCVGDVKQCIYGFRLAEPRQFSHRATELSDHARGVVIPLSDNFRSRGPLLDAINAVFERIMTSAAVEIEYDRDHRLRAGADYPTGQPNCFSGAPLELHLVNDGAQPDRAGDDDAEEEVEDLSRAEREATLVARRIRQIVGLDGATARCVQEKTPAGGFSSRPARYADIVVLLRSVHRKAEQYAAVLRRAGIPVFSQSGAGFFDAQEVRDMLALLSLLSNTQQDIPLAAVLRSPLLRLQNPEDLLARIRLAYPDDTPFHQAAAQCAADANHPSGSTLRAAFADIERWRHMAFRRPLDQAIADIYAETGFVDFCSGLPDGPQRRANLLHLHERAQQFGSFHRQGLERFLYFMDRLRDEDDLGQPQVVAESHDVVRIMSVHQSKGLEFPIVIVPDLGKRFNAEDQRGSIVADREAGLGMDAVDLAKQVRYPSLSSVIVKEQLRRQALAEEMRVLYVALTRAREHLILIGTCHEKNSAGWAERWRGHAGQLPAEVILDAGTPLHWIGPAAAAAGPGVIEVMAPDDAPPPPPNADARPKADAEAARLERLASLAPLTPAPPADALAQEIIDRLVRTYRFAGYAHLPAARSVTGGKSGMATQEGGDDTPAAPAEGAVFSMPAFLAEHCISPAPAAAKNSTPDAGPTTLPTSFRSAPSHLNISELHDDFADRAAPCATERGVASHVVLQHLDFTRPCDLPDLKAQVGDLVAKHILFPAQADMIDMRDLHWFCKSEIGLLMREQAKSLLRELPVYFALEVEAPEGTEKSVDPRDRVMVRGRLDALIVTGDGAVIVDYKTDTLDAREVDTRAAMYRPQLDQYRGAIERITGQAVRRAVLVFLAARKIVDL